tara:strand:+ start:3093 stop:3548 length:456 start_codon:yes stop_codon:yes gene_type:complete
MTQKIIQFIDGPNLNMLGEREPDVYGSQTLQEIHRDIRGHMKEKNMNIDINFFQSNQEGDIVNCIQNSKKLCSGLIINPGGFSHTSVAILDALLAIDIPKIEVHLSNLFKREEFRHHSYVSKGVNGVICGFGSNGYLLAVDAIIKLMYKEK